MVAPADPAGSFETLAQAHFHALYNMAIRLTRHPQEAEDLVQESLLRAYRFFDKFERGSNFKAWIFRILKNSFINRYRKVHKEPDRVEFGAIEDDLERLLEPGVRGAQSAPMDPERIFMEGVIDGEIEEALAQLPPDYRMVLIMAVMEEMSYEEISSALEIPIGTVMSRLHRARRLLQASLIGYARRRGLIDSGEAPRGGAARRTNDVIDISRFRRAGRQR